MNNPFDEEAIASAYDSVWSYDDHSISQLANEVVRAFSDRSGRLYILDIGIGTASLTASLARKLALRGFDCQVFGFDKSAAMLKIAKSRIPDANLCVWDANDGIPASNQWPERFHIIIATFVLHYISESKLTKFLEEVSKRLVSNGLFVQAEVEGDLAFVDGDLYCNEDANASSIFHRFWAEYFELRAKISKWNPVVRPSCYLQCFSELRRYLAPFAGFRTSKRVAITSETCIEWIRSGFVSSLSDGLTRQNRDDLARQMRAWLPEGTSFERIESACRFTILRNRSRDDDDVNARSLLGIRQSTSSNLVLDYGSPAYLVRQNTLNPDLNFTGLYAVLDNVFVPALGGHYLDCEIVVLDFLKSRGEWASVSRFRPKFSQRRQDLVKKLEDIGSSLIEDMLREFQDSPFFIKSNFKKASLTFLDSKERTLTGEIKQKVHAHVALANNANEFTYCYYIPAAFKASAFGIGGAIVVSDYEIDLSIIEFFRLVAITALTPLGVSYLFAEQRRTTIRATRAAIFARNFSHVTGSHVISNPEFAEQLVGNGRAKLLSHFTAAKERFDADYKAEIAFETNHGPPLTTDRWEPWNDVECLLSESIKQLGKPRLDLKAINRFHGYLQARFDFIARAIENTQDQPEPVFFIAELFNGFLEQEEFLDTLVADLGVRLADMKFEVRFELGDNNSSLAFVRTFERAVESNSEANSDCRQWVSERGLGNIEQHDFLVGLPGGMIAAQAFYSLLENVIRNSVKYQPKSIESEPYTVTVVIKDFERRKWDQCIGTLSQASDGDLENRYLIAIHDNWSMGDAGYEKVRHVIETPLVSPEGKPESLGLGVQEMKLCAESLVTADFKSSLNRTEREGSRVVAKGKLSDSHQNFQIRTSELADPLTFLLELEQPVLLKLVTDTSTSTFSNKSIVRVESSVKPVFKGQSAHILVVDAQNQGELAAYLNNEDKNHRLLPCRVLVLGNGRAKLHEGLKRWVAGRRVRFLSCATAYDILFDSQNASGTPAQKDTNLDIELSKTCCSIGWNDWWNKKIDAEKTSAEKDKLRVLVASVAWLRAYKTPEMKKPADSSDRPCAFKPWLLCIGFERTHAQVAEAWRGILAEFNQHSDLIKVIVRSSPKDGAAKTVDGSYIDSSLSFDENDPKAFINTHLNELDESVRKRLIVFDNHGKCFGKKWSHEAEKACDYQDSVRYFQTFSGGTPDLYRILSRPPKSIFGFSFLIHSLVESCLTNVSIVDERLAGDLMFGDAEDGTTGNDFDNRLATHQKSGVFPVFTMAPKSDASAGRKGHFTPEHKSAFEKLVKNDVCSREGIAYPVLPNQNDTAELQILKLNNDKQFELRKSGELLNFDVLIVHEGALDILQGKDGIEWKPEYDCYLYEIAPFVFRTSGRGRETKNFQTTVPFIEFHIVSSAVLTSRNKYGLIRGVLGTTGQDS